jgi:birA, biotin-[acetyl-CoA-carboxylase] ligase region
MYSHAIDVACVDERVEAGVAGGVLEPGVAQRVRIMARLYEASSAGVRVSGEAVAGVLGVSRAAVHKHMEALRQVGVDLDSLPGGGYQLRGRPDAVVPEVVLPLVLGGGGNGLDGPSTIARLSLGLPYRYFAATESTNRSLKEVAQRGAPAGAVVVTDDQVDGQGRLGRTWVSRPGKDLTFSVLIRPHALPAEAPRLVLAAGLAVAEVVGLVLGPSHSVGIKWPNDVLVDGRKVCGILSEASMDMDRLHWVVVGIGLNVNGGPSEDVVADRHDPSRFAPALLAEYAGAAVSRPDLLARLFEALTVRWGQVDAGAWNSVREACIDRDVLRGTQVAVRSGFSDEDLLIEGTAAGLGPEGELLVRGADGATRAVRGGDVTLR